MERLVFYSAIAFAALAALAFAAGGQVSLFNVDWEDGHYSGRTDEVVAVAPEQVAAQTFAATEIEVKHAAVRLTLIPEARSDVVVEIDNPGLAPTPRVSLDGVTLIVDGLLRGRIQTCSHEGSSLRLRGYGELSTEDLPHVTIRAPQQVLLDISGASVSDIGPAQSVEASIAGCGITTIADVAGALDLDVAGIGSVTAGAANSLRLDLAGTAKVQVGAVATGASISVAGTGEARLASLAGSLDAESAGVGDIVVDGGAITTADISLAGPGSARIAAPIERLDAEVMGPGRIEVSATVGDLDAEIAGPGAIRVQAVTGEISRNVWGPGSIVVGQ